MECQEPLLPPPPLSWHLVQISENFLNTVNRCGKALNKANTRKWGKTAKQVITELKNV